MYVGEGPYRQCNKDDKLVGEERGCPTSTPCWMNVTYLMQIDR